MLFRSHHPPLTREGGVRNLERELSNLIRKAVKELILSEKKSVKASIDNLADYLGVYAR